MINAIYKTKDKFNNTWRIIQKSVIFEIQVCNENQKHYELFALNRDLNEAKIFIAQTISLQKI